MEIRQIECFLACEQEGSFTAAARTLNLVQSAVSTSVAKLERELGARLFDRTPHGLRLTDAGREAVAPARIMLRARHDIADGIDRARGHVRGEVVIGNFMNIHTLDYANIISELRVRYPEVTLQMRQNISGVRGNIAGLRDGSLEIALVAGMTEEIEGLTMYPISSETIVLGTAPGHPLAGRPFDAADLAGTRFIDFAPGWGIRGVADALFPERDSVIEVADQVFAMELAAKDFGVLLIPRSTAATTDSIVWSERAGTPIPWHLAVAHDANRTPSNAARIVIRALCRCDRE
ncbi:LysR family transcriptional regulator [Nocardia sp. NPDC056000]|uniref:LysR family transcriptional regulator n=1 Tax=Nocardia sp. NPDC056000 TaxID=3345674 RepID=UPI0035D81304